MWRQGDLLIEAVERVPADAVLREGSVLVEGEATGHCHAIEDPATARVYEREGVLFLDVTAPWGRIVHPEHGPIPLAQGCYRVWRQRVYLGEERTGFVVD
jgi:hypothetical protein